jgi:tripartite-type tricarboxylate transporter receptor subunit TctC
MQPTSEYSRRTALGVLGVTFASFIPGLAQAQSQQAIRIIVPYSPGGGPDLLARILAEELRQRRGEAAIVENKPGASGNIGTEVVARALPDGQTLLMAVNALVMNEGLYRSIPYDPVTSFAPVVEVATGALALVVHPSMNVGSFAEFLALVRSKPSEFNYSSPGRGTPQHLAMELLKLKSKINLTHVPYPGSAGASRDLVGGFVSASFLPVHTALPLIESGQIRVLAIGSPVRVTQLPQVPTLVELGVAEFDVDLWFGVLAPVGTPKEIIDRYNAALNEILATPSVRSVLEKNGLTARGGPPERLAELIAKDRARWAAVIRDAGIAPEQN